MMITAATVADKLTAYLQHKLSLADLVDWAEDTIQNGDFADEGLEDVRDVVARLGVADVRAFGLTWGDCESLLMKLGYSAHVEVAAR